MPSSNYPTSLDTTSTQVTPSSTTDLDASGYEHDQVHGAASTAIIALETKLGIGTAAAENVGYQDILEYFSGPTGIAVIQTDPVEAAKVLKNFSTENEAFIVKGGLMDEEPLTIEQLNVLASIDSRDVLLAKIAGGFNAPVSKLAGTIKGVLNKSGYAFKALLEKKESTGEKNSQSEESEASNEAKEEIKKEEE